MSDETRTIGLQNLPDAIRVMNESSVGMSFEWRLDIFSFLSLARYWNIALNYTMLGYVDDEPASLIVACTDPEARDAYTLYWGALPRFRSRPTSIALFDACCQKLFADGYIAMHGVSVPDRPVRRYRFIQALPEHRLMDMQAQSPILPEADPSFSVRQIDVEVASQIVPPPGEPLHWCQRRSFLRNAASFLQFIGAFSGDVLKAYAVSLVQASNTTLLDLRSAESSPAAGFELLRWLLLQHYRPPFSATYVFEQSYAHRVLADAGFTVKRQFSTLFRDLRTTCGPRTPDL